MLSKVRTRACSLGDWRRGAMLGHRPRGVVSRQRARSWKDVLVGDRPGGAEVAPPTQGTRARAARTWLSARSRFVEGLIAKQRPEQDSKVLPDPSTEELKVGREPPHTAHTHAHARTQRRPPPNAMLRTCYDTWTRAQGSEGERERERGAEDRVAFVRVDVFSMNERRTDWGRERRDHRWRLA